MVFFEFGSNVIEHVIEELSMAKEYIRIAMFQIHKQAIFDILNTKLKEGVKVEIFTLPFDSINDDIRNRVVKQFQLLESNGAEIYLCRWNIGNPARTTTAVGRWYSFHGKFIITDNSAIALSANLTDQNEMDASLIFRNEPEEIKEFNKKFDQLLNLFIREYLGYEGKIRSLVSSSAYPKIASLFELPEVINDGTHKNYWINDYPSELCPNTVDIQSRLYVCPFDVRGRNILQKLFEEAEQFLYVSTESFTDPEIIDSFVRRKLQNIEVKILSGSSSMDFSDRMQKILIKMLGSGVQIKTANQDLHAKLIITDKCVAVSSINLNKMNLGFQHNSKLWRENTETICISSNLQTILDAKNQYNLIFENCMNIADSLAEKLEQEIITIFSKYFQLRSEKVVKKLFSRYIIQSKIRADKSIIRIGEITQRIMNKANRKTVRKDDFLMALILQFLSENKLSRTQIEQHLSILDTKIDLDYLLNVLQTDNFIEKEDDYYKLSVLSLF